MKPKDFKDSNKSSNSTLNTHLHSSFTQSRSYTKKHVEENSNNSKPNMPNEDNKTKKYFDRTDRFDSLHTETLRPNPSTSPINQNKPNPTQKTQTHTNTNHNTLTIYPIEAIEPLYTQTIRSTYHSTFADLEELIEKITELKQTVAQLTLLISREKDDVTKASIIKELCGLQASLQAKLQLNSETYNFEAAKLSLNRNPLTSVHLNKTCSVFTASKWLNGRVTSLCAEPSQLQQLQVVSVSLIGGGGATVSVPYYFVKPNKGFSPRELQRDFLVQAVSSVDGLWYSGKIVGVFREFVEVLFEGGVVEKVGLDSLCCSPEQWVENSKVLAREREKEKEKERKEGTEEDDGEEEGKGALAGFVIPEHLRLSQTDDEQQRLAKRKRVKALKHNFKQKVLDKANKEKQDNWLSFVSGNSAAFKMKFGKEK